VKQHRHNQLHSWLTAIIMFLAVSVFIVPAVWLGYAGFGVLPVFGFGFLVTVFAFFLARIDGMRLRISKGGLRIFAVTYLQITAILFVLFVIGRAAAT
jgi:hypothetical protein